MKIFTDKVGIVVLCVTAILLVTPKWIGAWQASHPTPVIKPMPSPNAPKNENVPQGLDGTVASKEEKKQMLDQQNEQEIRLEVQRLYAMATELKDEVDNTNSYAVLNVSVLKRTQEIEKLAKQIRDRAKK
jgi:hypothetical protein